MKLEVNGYTFIISTSYDYRDSRMFVGVGLDDDIDTDYISALKIAQKAMQTRKELYRLMNIYEQSGVIDSNALLVIMNNPDALFTEDEYQELTRIIANGTTPLSLKEYKLSDRRRMVFERDCFTCQNPHCRHHDPVGMDLQVDHIIPSSRGGSNRKENLQTLCTKCNQQKSAMTMDEYLAWIGASNE